MRVEIAPRGTRPATTANSQLPTPKGLPVARQEFLGSWRLGVFRGGAGMKGRAAAAKESSYVSRERQPQARPRPERLDRVVHDRMRLAILAALAANETLSFTDLKAITGTTDGN